MLTLNRSPIKYLYSCVFAVSLSISILTPVYGQNGGTTSIFVDGGAGARALGLGKAFVALADDPSAVYWNAAGLDFIEKKSASFFYSNLIISGANHNFIGLAYPTTTIGTFGFGWIRFGVDGISVREDAEELSKFNYAHQLFLFSYGKQIKRNLSIGGSVKIENLSFAVNNTSDTSVGFDFGILYRPDFDGGILRDISFGANVQNLWSPKIKLNDEAVSSPTNFKLGLAKPIFFGEDRNALTFVFDLNKGEKSPMSFHFGGEFAFRDAATLRVGYNDGQIALGAGAGFRSYKFDYNFGKLYDATGFSANHRFSITIEFGKTKNELIRIAEQRRQLVVQLARDQSLRLEYEADYHTNMEDGRTKFYSENDYIGAYVKFDAARTAAEQLIVVAMRQRGDTFDDPEANMLVETANSLLQEAEALRAKADAKDDSVRQAQRKEAYASARKSALETELNDFIIDHRDKGNEFFKNGFFTRAISEWQLVLDEIETREIENVAWIAEVKKQLEENIANAQEELKGNVQEAINRANRLVQRGRYRQALDALYQLRGPDLSESERKTVEAKISRLQNQLGFDQNFNDGVRYYESKDWKQAADAFQRALKLRPKDRRTKEFYDNAYARSIATRQDMPQNLKIKFFRGVQFYREGKYKEALDIWEECRKVQPYNKDILESIDRAKNNLNKK